MKRGITLQAINTFGIPLSNSYFHIILKKNTFYLLRSQLSSHKQLSSLSQH